MTIQSNTAPQDKDDRIGVINKFLYLDGNIVRYKAFPISKVKSKRNVGDEVYCSINNNGYYQVCFGGIQMFLHVVIFALSKGRMPYHLVDHINGDKSDNRPSNLRECLRSENNWNEGVRKNNKSGFKNVRWHNQRGKWDVSIRTKYGRLSFGLYEDIELAGLVAEAAREKYHGEYARS
ncbi:HNH endonuclease [Pectobacterium aroidearum]|uniref:HNH endonuclease n=1 Tax=Pectobacterium aroidearum TaxID=1201031 RepID=UPI00301B22AE